jgi:hypothetical protein
MRLYCLNGDPAYPCFVLTVKGCTLMLDCALNMKSLEHFLPQTLVQSQRLESLPAYRSPATGTLYEQIKELNGRVYLHSTPEFSVPEFGLINIEDVDAVLISSASNMLALPYLTRMSGFRARIYCTEPTLNYGRMLMEELTGYVKSSQTVAVNNEQARAKQAATTANSKEIESFSLLNKFPLLKSLGSLAMSLAKRDDSSSVNKQPVAEVEDGMEVDDESEQPACKQAKLTNSDSTTVSEDNSKSELTSWKQSYTQFGQLLNLNDGHMKPLNWKYIYSRSDVEACIALIKTVDFNERLDVFGSVTVQARSSGIAIGACNWSIECDADLVCYVARSSLLNTHAKLFDAHLLRQHMVDCLILSGLNRTQFSDPVAMIHEFCKACVATLKSQGCVLVPSMPTGKIYDLIEHLYK